MPRLLEGRSYRAVLIHVPEVIAARWVGGKRKDLAIDAKGSNAKLVAVANGGREGLRIVTYYGRQVGPSGCGRQ